jgi:hypothetical protein
MQALQQSHGTQLLVCSRSLAKTSTMKGTQRGIDTSEATFQLQGNAASVARRLCNNAPRCQQKLAKGRLCSIVRPAASDRAPARDMAFSRAHNPEKRIL